MLYFNDNTNNQDNQVPLHLLDNEPLADGARRIISELLEHANAQLTSKNTHPDTAVHEVRKSVKKLHALLRLIRPALKKKTFQHLNTLLRQLRQQLGSSRDSAVLPQTLDTLTAHFAMMLNDTALQPVRQSLANRHSLALQQQQAGLDITGAQKQLAELAQQLSLLDLDCLSRKTLTSSIRKTYRCCQQALKKLQASPTTENSHAFRTQVKRLRIQCRLLRKWPRVTPAPVTQVLRNIEQALGQDHDLAMLVETLRAHPEISCNSIRRETLISLAETRRIVLLSSALRAAVPVFKGKAKKFAS